jgi:hypothetical protein
MLEILITSKTRLKLLLKFFLNPESKGYLRSLESEFKESTNGIRLELNRFEDAGMLVSQMDGNKKIFQANAAHPLFNQLQTIIHNYVGLDRIIDNVVVKLGSIELVYLIGDFAKGIDREFIELVFVGDVDQEYLKKLIQKVEIVISKKIIYTVLNNKEFNEDDFESRFLIWNK